MKFLRILFLFLFTCLFLSLCACAEELPFEYVPLSETEAEITRCNIAYGEIIIPPEIDGYTITSIADSAFEDCHGLTGEIIIPESVKSIGDSAFAGCWNLNSVVLPDNIENLGSMAFLNCYKLKSVDLGGLKEIPYMSFAYCRSLDSITLPESCALVGGMAFENCTSLSRILVTGETKFSGSLNRYGKPAIYCFAGSPAENWAKSEDLEIVLLDGKTAEDYLQLSLATDFKINLNESRTLAANIFPLSLRSALKYESSAPEIISVDANGRLIAHKTGSAVITASVGDVSASVRVTSVIPVEDFTIVPESRFGLLGGEIQFTIKTVPENADGDILWHSTDNSVLRMNLTGGIAEAYGLGTAQVSALVNGIEKRIGYSVYTPGELLILPDALSLIDREAFAGTSVKEILLGGSVTHIESRAFADNPHLARIYMPDSITSIAADAFEGSRNVRLICQSDNFAAGFARANAMDFIIEGE